ncbi:hypothetical protein [Runella zeae]|nr:hypothetical protein [Runella zeae]
MLNFSELSVSLTTVLYDLAMIGVFGSWHGPPAALDNALLG